jgi:hypothetical protein
VSQELSRRAACSVIGRILGADKSRSGPGKCAVSRPLTWLTKLNMASSNILPAPRYHRVPCKARSAYHIMLEGSISPPAINPDSAHIEHAHCWSRVMHASGHAQTAPAHDAVPQRVILHLKPNRHHHGHEEKGSLARPAPPLDTSFTCPRAGVRGWLRREIVKSIAIVGLFIRVGSCHVRRGFARADGIACATRDLDCC